MNRMGMMNATNSNSNSSNEGSDVYRYNVKRLFFSSGKLKGTTQDTYYPSHKQKSGLTTFWLVDFHTMHMENLHAAQLPGSPINSDVETSQIRISIHAAYLQRGKRAEFLDVLDHHCVANPDKVFDIFGPGCRSKSDKGLQYQKPNVPIFCRSKSGECVRAAVVNGIHIISPSDAESVLKERPGCIRNLTQASLWLEKFIGRYHLESVDVPLYFEVDQWLQGFEGGIFLMWLVGINDDQIEVDHVVTLNLEEKLILDCEEEVALRLSRCTTVLCRGWFQPPRN